MSLFTSTIQNRSKNDLYETPPSALKMVLEHLDPSRDVLWEPFPGSNFSTQVMESFGFKVVHNVGTEDFFKSPVPYYPPGKSLVLITNPPFSRKHDVLRHVIEKLGITRFAILLPAATVYTSYFYELVEKYTLMPQVIAHCKRCRFLDPITHGPAVDPRAKPTRRGNCAASFDVSWVCVGLGLPRDFLIKIPDRSID